MSRTQLSRTEEQLLDHKEYIRRQFERLIKPSFRDIIFHASFIEAVGQILKDKKVELGSFLELNLQDVKNLRNSLLHHVIHDKLTKKEIEDKIAEIFKLIWPIYRSGPFGKYFNLEYGINLTETTDQHLGWYRGEPASDTSGNVVQLPSKLVANEKE